MRPLTQNTRPKSNDNQIICPPVNDDRSAALLNHDINTALEAAADYIATCDELNTNAAICLEHMKAMENSMQQRLTELKKSGDALMAAIDEALENIRRQQ